MFTPAAPPNFYPPALNFTLDPTGTNGQGRFPDDLAKVLVRQGAQGNASAVWTHSLVTGVCSNGYWYDFDTSPTCNTAVLGSQTGYVPDYPPDPSSVITIGSQVLCRSATQTGNVFYKGHIASGSSVGPGSWVCMLDDVGLPILVNVANDDLRTAGPPNTPIEARPRMKIGNIFAAIA